MGLYILIGVVAFIIIIAMWFASVYNRLIALRNLYKQDFSGIDVQLKRRYDLIPNLVETAKGYMKHESQTLEAVIAARNSAFTAHKQLDADPNNPESTARLFKAEGAFSGALGRLMAVSEAYPDLKANTQMQQLMADLTATEEKIAHARQSYNQRVTTYNTAREVFPNNIVAGMFGFFAAVLFEITDEAERQNVKVHF